jgi:hypothetical protein
MGAIIVLRRAAPGLMIRAKASFPHCGSGYFPRDRFPPVSTSMGSISPVQIALLIVAGLSIIGVIIAFIRWQMTYSGYAEITNDVRRIGLALRGEIFRDGSDVVVSGTFEQLPTVVRFSNAENTPGLNIRIQAPATFLLSVVPSGTQVTEGGHILVKTADEWFDARFNTRTDQPTQAKMFINRPVTNILQRLACSKNTYVSVGKGAIELSELMIPMPNTGQHTLEHLKMMAKLSNTLKMMPGSDSVKLVAFKRERHIAARVAIAVGAAVALASIFAAMRVPSRQPVTGVNQTLASGILPIEAYRIPNANDWRAATADDLDPAAVSWLRDNRQKPESRIEGDFSGRGTGRDVVYLLVGPDGTRRVVVLAANENRYDTKFPYIGVAARVPKGMVNSIKWVGKPPEGMQGDGILLLRKQDDPSSAVVLFLSGHGIISASPVNYQEISLE